ncbi:MAG: AAA family ATPase, partial [Candidatus Binatia bacterium]
TQTVTQMIAYATTVKMAPEVAYYVIDLVQATREDPALALGASPRASIALLRASRALAASDGRTDVYPDDVRAVLQPVLAHRIILNPDAMLRGENEAGAIERVVGKVKPPTTGGARKTAPARKVAARA